ncbi:protein FAM133-like isoform X1 [Pistacia vera]|uniref:protein FAM133-like isoform X1 n=1 Tax=Pistacia vera TaxID=55513 RepID=UPI0012635120|nr:protein FAM133-like isoform X1 [Pistacia vera]
MKRAWSDKDDDSSSSSDSDAESDDSVGKRKKKTSQVNSGRKKSGVDFEALKRFGYRGGLSVLKVPPPKEDEKQDWSWSTGREHCEVKKYEESSEEQHKTRAGVLDEAQLTNVQTQKEEKKNLSFSQKEKRKRELGQASRGKSYVEEEKRLLRESGIYSGFDT